MAKIYLNRLMEKYGLKQGEVSGYNYKMLMRDIIANQSENISKMTMRISNDNFARQISKVKKTEKKMILPNIDEVFPKKSVFIRKGAIDGDVITNTLRDSLTKNLRDTLENFKTKKTKEPAYIKRAGETAGEINPEVVKNFEKTIMKTFEGYTKIHPKYGMPANIHTIAVTEIRTTINPMKSAYNERLYELNKDTHQAFKMWKHNRSLSKKPRIGHVFMNGKKIPIYEMFKVPLYEKVRGNFVRTGTDDMRFPHDPNANEKQVIGCNCDVIYFFEPKPVP